MINAELNNLRLKSISELNSQKVNKCKPEKAEILFFSFNFVKWYSGMSEVQIKNAYKRYKKEVLKIDMP